MGTNSYSIEAIRGAVGLVNLYVNGSEAVSWSALCSLLERYDLDEQAIDTEEFGELAAQVRTVFVTADRTSRIASLNRLLERFEPRPRLVEHGHEPLHFHHRPADEAPLEHVGASCVMALADAMIGGDDDRLGLCQAPRCSRVFFDQTRARSQRYCSRTCATRVHVAAHRARR